MSLTKVSYSMIQGSPVNVFDFIPVEEQNAIVDGTSTYDCTTAIQDAFAVNQSIVFPSGVYNHTGLDFSGYDDIRIVGQGIVKLNHTGTGAAISFDNATPTVTNHYRYYIEGIQSWGNINTSYGWFLSHTSHGTLINCRAHNVTSAGFYFAGVIECVLINPICSRAPSTFDVQPDHGLVITESSPGNYSVGITCINPIFEGLAGTGIWCISAQNCNFIGGTSEINNRGVVDDVKCYRNLYKGMWFEANAYSDMEFSGQLASVENCFSVSNPTQPNIICLTSQSTQFNSSYLRWVELQATSTKTLFVNCEMSDSPSLGIDGAGDYKMINHVYTNTSGVITESPVDKIGTSSSFLATATGFTTTISQNIYYSAIGAQVTLRIPTFTGTSNATSFTLTGLPAELFPAYLETCLVRVQDNSGTILVGYAEISPAGAITIYASTGGASFTASGTKSLYATSITYFK